MDNYTKAAEKIASADGILITASNGLSITEGLNLFANDEKFHRLFGDFVQRYGLSRLLHGMASRYENEERTWAFWARLIKHYCIDYTPSLSMKKLKEIVGDKDYFIVTSNGEGHFEKSGFDPDKIYEVEGTWLDMQCSVPCHDTLYPAEKTAEEIAKNEDKGTFPAELIPCCPLCGAPMVINMGAGQSFIENKRAINNYREFTAKYKGKNLVVIELGIGRRNTLIKAPEMKMVANEPGYFYITVNKGEIFIPDEIESRSIGFDGLIEPVLVSLAEAKNNLN